MTHPEMVKKLAKPGHEVLKTLTPEKVELMHMAFGLATEVGEMCDAVKKHIFYNLPIDRENVIEESGDFEFYHEGLRQILDFARSTAIQYNMEKLLKRYSNYDYSDTKAKERADKV